MAELKKHALLLSVMGFLLVIKFVIVPLMEWQEAIFVESAQLEKRLTKVEAVLANEDTISSGVLVLKREIAKVDALLFKSEAESIFKLEQQQLLEQLLESNELNASNFSWQAKTPLPELDAYKYQVNIRFDGKLANVINTLVALEAHTPWYEIENFNLTTKGNRNESLGFVSGGRVMLNIYVKFSLGDEPNNFQGAV